MWTARYVAWILAAWLFAFAVAVGLDLPTWASFAVGVAFGYIAGRIELRLYPIDINGGRHDTRTTDG